MFLEAVVNSVFDLAADELHELPVSRRNRLIIPILRNIERVLFHHNFLWLWELRKIKRGRRVRRKTVSHFFFKLTFYHLKQRFILFQFKTQSNPV